MVILKTMVRCILQYKNTRTDAIMYTVLEFRIFTFESIIPRMLIFNFGFQIIEFQFYCQ